MVMWDWKNDRYYLLLTRGQAIAAHYPIPDDAVALRVYWGRHEHLQNTYSQIRIARKLLWARSSIG